MTTTDPIVQMYAEALVQARRDLVLAPAGESHLFDIPEYAALRALEREAETLGVLVEARDLQRELERLT